MALSKPVVLLLIVAVGLGIYAYADGGPEKSTTPPPTTKRHAHAMAAGWDFPPLDNSIHFDKLAPLTRDPFLPAVKNIRAMAPPMTKDDIVQIPGRLADGEGGWAYTGMVEVDGSRLALLENSSTKKMGYVREGEDWKKAHVVGITTACIVLADEKGVPETIYRFNPNDPPKVKAPPEGGFQPLNPGNIPPGRIGAGMQIRPLPGGASGPRVTTSFGPSESASMVLQ